MSVYKAPGGGTLWRVARTSAETIVVSVQAGDSQEKTQRQGGYGLAQKSWLPYTLHAGRDH